MGGKDHDKSSGQYPAGGLCVSAHRGAGGRAVFLPAGAAVVVDGACGLLQYIVFKIRKKLLMRGYTLHEHLQKKGHGDHAVIAVPKEGNVTVEF